MPSTPGTVADVVLSVHDVRQCLGQPEVYPVSLTFATRWFARVVVSVKVAQGWTRYRVVGW